MSLSAGAVETGHELGGAMLLHDDSGTLAGLLRESKQTVWVLDNCGLELLSDLLAVHWLLKRGTAVSLHCKVRH